MAEFPALPLWTDAYLADTSHLSDAERGRYDLMLIHLWRMPEVRFPNDDIWLARKFNRTVDEIKTDFRPLVEEFFKSTGNWITQKRLMREREYVREQSKKQSERAKSRWEKENSICRGSTTSGNATSGNAPTPTPTPTPQKKESVGRASRWDPTEKVPEDWFGMAAAKRSELELPEIDLRLEAEKFVNHWSSAPGARGTKIDWRKTWINWVLSSNQGKANGQARRPTSNDKFLAGALQFYTSTDGGHDDPAGEGGATES